MLLVALNSGGCGNKQGHLVSLRRSSQSIAHGIALALPSRMLRPSASCSCGSQDGRPKPGALQCESPESQCGQAGSFPLLLWLLLCSCRRLRCSCNYRCITSIFCGLLLCLHLCLHAAQGSLCSICFPELGSRNGCPRARKRHAGIVAHTRTTETLCQMKSQAQGLGIKIPAYFGERQFNF